MKRIQIRMKMTKDTRRTCERLRQMWQPYFEGRTPPHFPVPAIPLEVEQYPDPLVMIIATFPVDDQNLKEERYWKAVWRSDGTQYL